MMTKEKVKHTQQNICPCQVSSSGQIYQQHTPDCGKSRMSLLGALIDAEQYRSDSELYNRPCNCRDGDFDCHYQRLKVEVLR